MFNTVAGKRIALFGFAFKASTGDTRESSALTVAQALLAERAVLVITDPKALDNAKRDLSEEDGQIYFEKDPYRCASGAHALAILTEWQEFVDLDYQKIYESMEKPAFIFDGRNILDHRRLFDIGFNVFTVGNPPLYHL